GFLPGRLPWRAEQSFKAGPRRHGQAEAGAVDDEHEGRKGHKDWQRRHPQKLAVGLGPLPTEPCKLGRRHSKRNGRDWCECLLGLSFGLTGGLALTLRPLRPTMV